MTQRLIFLICLLFAFSAGSQTIYFPPLDNSEWKTTDPKSLGWNTALLPDLQSFLETTHTKAFILLKDGKIVLEYYLNGHTAALPRYWALSLIHIYIVDDLHRMEIDSLSLPQSNKQ